MESPGRPTAGCQACWTTAHALVQSGLLAPACNGAPAFLTRTCKGPGMTVDPQQIRAEPHVTIGALLQRDAGILIDRWARRAVQDQPNARRLHHDALLDHLPSLLWEMGRSLAEADEAGNSRHLHPAREHGEDRWEAGWSVVEVVRDYQILRLVVVDYLEETLDRPLRGREVMAVGLTLDEAIAASVGRFARFQEEAVRQGERERAEREKQAEEQRQQRQLEGLQESERRKDEFLAVLGHELRNPLAPIRNALQVLRLRGEDAETRGWAGDLLERQVPRMTRLLDDLLDVSRIGQGKLLLRRQPLDLARLVRGAAEDHRVILQAAGLALEVAVPAEPVWVSGDPTRLAQVVGNLLGNAAKFTDPGGRVTVRLTADREARRAAV